MPNKKRKLAFIAFNSYEGQENQGSLEVSPRLKATGKKEEGIQAQRR